MRFCVAVDGPASAGKGTICRALAERFGFAYLDTGLLYRAVGAKSAAGIVPPVAARNLTEADLERDDLRTAEAGQQASRVAAMPAVREALLRFQRDFARRDGGAILDGRDIGTVICPDADVKIFVTADDAERARRRHAELAANGSLLSLEQVRADLARRDSRDSGRETSPMAAAGDAVLLDTTELTVEAAIESAAAEVERALESESGRV